MTLIHINGGVISTRISGYRSHFMKIATGD